MSLHIVYLSLSEVLAFELSCTLMLRECSYYSLYLGVLYLRGKIEKDIWRG